MNLTTTGVALRFIFALLLVLLSYNPAGFSYFHWVHQSLPNVTPYIAIAGLALIIGWGIYVKATLNSLGFIGIIILCALFASLIWLFIYWKWLSLSNTSAMAWIVEILLALLLTVGICWSHITRRLSGQVDVEENDER